MISPNSVEINVDRDIVYVSVFLCSLKEPLYIPDFSTKSDYSFKPIEFDHIFTIAEFSLL